MSAFAITSWNTKGIDFGWKSPEQGVGRSFWSGMHHIPLSNSALPYWRRKRMQLHIPTCAMHVRCKL